MTASPEQLQIMLLDGAIRFATKAADCIQKKDRESAFGALDRAQRITLELGIGLNPEANSEMVEQMRALYNFVYKRLIDANMNQDVQAIDEAVRILKHQRDTWTLIAEKVKGVPNATEAVPANKPTGTTGLIAGRVAGPSPLGDSAPRFVAEA